MTHQRCNEQSQRRDTHRDKWDIPSAHETTYMLQELIGNYVIPVLEKHIHGKYLGTFPFCRLESSVPELTAPAFPPLNEGWQNPAVTHPSLGCLQSQASGGTVSAPWAWAKSVTEGGESWFRSQEPKTVSKFKWNLFSAFLNESLKVCMPGFNLSKEIKKYCYINTNIPGIQQPAHITPPHWILFTRLTLIKFSRILLSECVLGVEQGKQEEEIASIMLRSLKEKMY